MDFPFSFDMIKYGSFIMLFKGSQIGIGFFLFSGPGECFLALPLQTDHWNRNTVQSLYTWVKVFMIIPEFGILRLTFH